MSKGKYIVIEGPEGVGKSTQITELARRLQAAGLPIRTLREPDSQSDLTARAIRQLTQDPRYPMNTTTEVLLYNAARAQLLQVVARSVAYGVTCIVDRNYLTTLAIQYYGRGDVPDYETINRIIKFAVNGVEPDLTIVLDAPVQQLMSRLAHRNGGERFDNLEAAFLERVRAGYLWEANQRNYPIVVASGSVEEIAERIWKHVATTLGQRNQVKEPSKSETNADLLVNALPIEQYQTAPNEPLVVKQDGHQLITTAGTEILTQAVTNIEGNVYGFYDYFSPSTVAAAMARLSRRGDDMRLILLDEFAANKGKDSDLLKRVITAYGDDSVQQLSGVHLVVEQASNLLTKKLEWGRLAAYLEQSTRYIYYDQKDKAGNFRYFVPSNLKPKLKASYKQSLDQIFTIYSNIVHQLTDYISVNSSVPNNERDGAFRSSIKAQACDAARAILPVSTTSTVGIYASAQALESLVMHLLADDFQEARDTGQALLDEARKIIPMFLERADLPDRGGASIAYRANTAHAMQELADRTLAQSLAPTSNQSANLVDFWPHNELDLVADMLYEYTNLPLKTIRQEVATWSYGQKAAVIKTYCGERLNRRHRPGRALEKAHYSWDILCDYGIFRDLQRHRMVDDLAWQPLTPRYGFEIPDLIEKAGLVDQFEQAFEISLKLHSELIAAKHTNEAQYATLLGHKMRWKLTYNAREAFHLHELRTSPQGHPGYRRLIKDMHEQLSLIHPLIAESMIFVNRDEDPELTRLAAERYTQYKLQGLSSTEPKAKTAKLKTKPQKRQH